MSQDCPGTSSQNCSGTSQDSLGTLQDCPGTFQNCPGMPQDSSATSQDCEGFCGVPELLGEAGPRQSLVKEKNQNQRKRIKINQDMVLLDFGQFGVFFGRKLVEFGVRFLLPRLNAPDKARIKARSIDHARSLRAPHTSAQARSIGHANSRHVPVMSNQTVFALLCVALLCFALLCFALICVALLCFALLYVALLCFACFTLLCFPLLCFILLWFRGNREWQGSGGTGNGFDLL